MQTTIIILSIISLCVVLWIKFRPTKEQQFQNDIRKLAFKQYDGIVTLCEKAVETFGEKRLPLKIVNDYIDIAQIITDVDDQNTMQKVEIFNGTLKTFKKVLKLRSEEKMKDGKIGIEEIKYFVAKFKESLIESQENNAPKTTKNEQ